MNPQPLLEPTAATCTSCATRGWDSRGIREPIGHNMQDTPNTLLDGRVSLPPPMLCMKKLWLPCFFAPERSVGRTHGASTAKGPGTPVHLTDCSLSHPRRALRQSVNQRWGQNETWGQWAAHELRTGSEAAAMAGYRSNSLAWAGSHWGGQAGPTCGKRGGGVEIVAFPKQHRYPGIVPTHIPIPIWIFFRTAPPGSPTPPPHTHTAALAPTSVGGSDHPEYGLRAHQHCGKEMQKKKPLWV